MNFNSSFWTKSAALNSTHVPECLYTLLQWQSTYSSPCSALCLHDDQANSSDCNASAAYMVYPTAIATNTANLDYSNHLCYSGLLLLVISAASTCLGLYESWQSCSYSNLLKSTTSVSRITFQNYYNAFIVVCFVLPFHIRLPAWRPMQLGIEGCSSWMSGSWVCSQELSV